MVSLEKEQGSKKIGVTLDRGIYEIVKELKEKVYKTDSVSKVCASIIESYLNEHNLIRDRLNGKTFKD